jgi:hypothetical protein
MQQIIVYLIVVMAALFLARGIYRSVVSSRRSKAPTCGGCGTCEAAAGKDSAAAAPKV